jgi:hypothetical protein
MSWPMSHLYVASNIINDIPVKIKNNSQYFMGTLAPGAIHFRKNYDREEKRKSHLYNNIDKSDIKIYTEKRKSNVIEL